MAEERMNNSAEERREVAIKFGKGLMGEPFTSKAGKQLVEIKIPNPDPKDTRSWETFVVPVGFVHENKFGKGMWMKLPEDGYTKLSRPKVIGQDENGKNIWGSDTRTVSNQELKALVESYKERNRDQGERAGSGLSQLAEKKAEAAATDILMRIRSTTGIHQELNRDPREMLSPMTIIKNWMSISAATAFSGLAKIIIPSIVSSSTFFITPE